MEPDIYYYLKLVKDQIKMEQQLDPDFLVCKINGQKVSIKEKYVEEKWPTHLVPSLFLHGA